MIPDRAEWRKYATYVATAEGVGSSIRELARRHNVLLDELQRSTESAGKLQVSAQLVKSLADAAQVMMEQRGAHSAHWDPSGQHGLGCPACIEASQAAAHLRLVLAQVRTALPRRVRVG